MRNINLWEMVDAQRLEYRYFVIITMMISQESPTMLLVVTASFSFLVVVPFASLIRSSGCVIAAATAVAVVCVLMMRMVGLMTILVIGLVCC